MNQVAAKRSPSLDTVRIAAFNATGAVGEWDLQKDTVTLGRVSTNDVCLSDKKVSRNHCTLEVKPAGLLLRDLGSSNGTWVNGQKVTETFLKDLDVVVIAGFRLQISLERAAAGAPWDDKTALSAESADSTPAEDSNVIPMRAPVPASPADPRVRTEVVPTQRMEQEARAKFAAATAPRTEKMASREVAQAIETSRAAAPAPRAAAPAPAARPVAPAPAPAAETRPAVMYVGGKKIVKPAAPAKTNSQAAPAALAAREAKPRFTKGEKIGLVIGFLVWGFGWALIVGGLVLSMMLH